MKFNFNIVEKSRISFSFRKFYSFKSKARRLILCIAFGALLGKFNFHLSTISREEGKYSQQHLRKMMEKYLVLRH